MSMCDAGGRECSRIRERSRGFRGSRGHDSGGLGFREVRGRVPSAGIAPPPFVLTDPAQCRAAGWTGEPRLARRRVRPAVIAVPPPVPGNVCELPAARRTWMERAHRLDGGGDRDRGLGFGDRDERGHFDSFRDGLPSGMRFDPCLRPGTSAGGLFAFQFLHDRRGFPHLVPRVYGLTLDFGAFDWSRSGPRLTLCYPLPVGLRLPSVEVAPEPVAGLPLSSRPLRA